ncbi:non-specific lipid-transfer protein 2-like [Macadamia integrifolia]|uniref:non-specific lipid-transfer protein 2-like n=1 Tax=Macadamia integrifolia TaxID=60698 RepID=UPI001C4F3992|nr:non-specific lipid-transfer protein 2-like [Macadamia integrifolia]
MKKVIIPNSALCVMLVMMLVLGEVSLSMAVTCNALELSPCLPAITTGSAPSETCCVKLKEQESCLCGFAKDPNLRKYLLSPNAKKVATSCGIPIPTC